MITVWWKYDHLKNPEANEGESFNGTPLADKRHYKKFVGAVVYGWLERRWYISNLIVNLIKID